MPKIEINMAVAICKKHQVDPEILRAIVEDMNIEAQPDPGEDKPPAIKKQYTVLVSDPEDVMLNDDFVAWVLQIPENESPATTEERIRRAAYDYNTTKRGRLYPAKTVGEALENVPAKFFKEADLFVKTKIPVRVIKTNNLIPKE